MSEPVTIETLILWKDRVGTGTWGMDFSDRRLLEAIDLAISQAETIKAQGEEIERLRAALADANGWLKHYRKTDANQWTDLKEMLKSAQAELSKLKQERDEVLAWAKYWVAYTPKEITVRELGYRDAALEISKRLSKSDPTEGK